MCSRGVTADRLLCWVQVVSPVDPRIHFALVCGAKSCPPIKVYTPTSLQEGLDSATMAFCEGQRHRLELPPIGFVQHEATAALIALSCASCGVGVLRVFWCMKARGIP